ncbi:MAG: TonB-dependent receptor, partial [Pseudohongiellaceae bacterium]
MPDSIRIFFKTAILLAVIFWYDQLMAQDTGARHGLEEVLVISKGLPVSLRQAGTSVSLVSAEAIQARGNQFLHNVLRQFPGIASSTTGGSGQPASLRIRGEEGYRTLSLMDGIRLSDPAAVQIAPHFEHLISSGVGRVEILRGPQGLGYGADAGGIINISSPVIEQSLFASFDAQAGNFGTRQYGATIGGSNDRLDYFLLLTDFETEGFNIRESDSVLQDDDGYGNTTVHARAGYEFSERVNMDFVHRKVTGDSELDGCYSGSIIHNCTSDYELHASRISLNYDSGNISHSLAYAETLTDRENFALELSTFASRGELRRLEYTGSLTSVPGFDLVFGADWEESKNNGDGRNNAGVYVEYLSDFSDSLFFTAGVRHDDNDDFGTNTSYRLSGAYLIDLADSGTIKLKSSYGTGFRAPSPFEIGYNTGPFAYPPAAGTVLTQEFSQGFEIGMEYYSASELHLEAVYFDQIVKDAIYFDLAAFSGYLQDIGISGSSGTELSMQIGLFGGYSFNANYTYNKTERPDGTPRLRRPQHLGNFGLTYAGMGERFNLNAFMRISRDSIDEVGSMIYQLDDFQVLDLSASFRIAANFSVYGRVENALDEEYQEVADYNTPG